MTRPMTGVLSPCLHCGSTEELPLGRQVRVVMVYEARITNGVPMAIETHANGPDNLNGRICPTCAPVVVEFIRRGAWR